MKRILSVLLSVALLSVYAVAFSADYESHWAEKEIEQLVKSGAVKGDSSGIRPEDFITRAEFAAVINRTYKFTDKSENGFNDISSSDWYYNDMLIAKKAGYMAGDNNGNANPKSNLTRAEAAMIYYRLLKLEGENADNFTDYTNIPAWAKDAVGALYKAGIIKGYEDGSFKPSNNIKRGEAFYTIVKTQQLLGDSTVNNSSAPVTSATGYGTGSSTGGGGSSGGGGGGGSSSGTASVIADFTYIDSEKRIANWYLSDGAYGYELVITRTTPDVLTTQPIIVQVSGSSYNFANEIITLMSNDKQINESFSIKLVVKHPQGIFSSEEERIEVVNPSVKIPDDIRCEAVLNNDRTETVTISFTPPEHSSSYLLEMDFGDGYETLINNTSDSSVTLTSEQVSKLNFKHNIKFSAASNNPTYLDSENYEGELEVPMFYGEENGIMLIANMRHFMNMSTNPSAKYKLAYDFTGDYKLPESYEGMDFSGYFDGDGHTVEVSRNCTDVNKKYVGGIFNVLSGEVVVKNLIIEGSVSANYSSTGNSGTGALSGRAYDLKENACISNIINFASVVAPNGANIGGVIGEISDAKQVMSVENCYNYGEISANLFAGGVVGNTIGGVVKGCANYNTVKTTKQAAGGVVGYIGNTTSISECYNNGDVSGRYQTGGIVGHCNLAVTISDCFNTGSVKATGVDATGGAGGILGGLKVDAGVRTANIKNCYNTGNVEITSNNSHFYPIYTAYTTAVPTIGITASDSYYLSESGQQDIMEGTTPLTSAEMKNLASFTGFDSEIWEISGTYEFPQLINNPYRKAAVKLATPSIYSTYFDGTDVTVTLNGQEETVNYKITVIKNGEEIQSFVSEGGGNSEEVVITSAIILDEFDVDYTLVISALGNQLDVLDSSAISRTYKHERVKLMSPSGINVSWNYNDITSKEEYVISWNPVDSANSYLISISDGGTVVSEAEVSETRYNYELDTTALNSEKLTVSLTAVNSSGLANPSNPASKDFNICFAYGEGTTGNPYRIANLRHWNNINNDTSAHYRVISDIEETITSSINVFSGSITGWDETENKAVYRTLNIYLDDEDVYTYGTSVQYRIGLFSTLSGSASIKYLTLYGTVNAPASNVACYIAALAGETTKNAVVSDIVSNVQVIATASNYVGGIIGNCLGPVNNLKNNGSVKGKTYVGGIMCQMTNASATITSLENTGELTGMHCAGIIGLARNVFTITNSVNTGVLKGSRGNYGMVSYYHSKIVSGPETLYIRNCSSTTGTALAPASDNISGLTVSVTP